MKLLNTKALGSPPSAVAANASGTYLLLPDSNQIAQFSPGAEPAPLSPALVSTGGTEAWRMISFGSDLYVLNRASATISHLVIGAGGKLEAATTIATPTEPTSFCISPSGRHIYVASGAAATAGKLAIYKREAGVLSKQSEATLPTNVAGGESNSSTVILATSEWLLLHANETKEHGAPGASDRIWRFPRSDSTGAVESPTLVQSTASSEFTEPPSALVYLGNEHIAEAREGSIRTRLITTWTLTDQEFAYAVETIANLTVEGTVVLWVAEGAGQSKWTIAATGQLTGGEYTREAAYGTIVDIATSGGLLFGALFGTEAGGAALVVLEPTAEAPPVGGGGSGAATGTVAMGAAFAGAGAAAAEAGPAVAHHTVVLFTVNTSGGSVERLSAGATLTANTAGGSPQVTKSAATFAAAAGAGTPESNSAGAVFAASEAGGDWLDG